MTDLHFVDTNILIYAKDSRFPEKQHKAELLVARLWREGVFRISCQVIQEYYAVMARSFAPREMYELTASVMALLETDPVPITASLQRRALEIENSYKISWWDSLIVAAAEVAQCHVLITEDLQHGMQIGSITITNPFLPT